MGRFPDFVCIGAQKAGTTWLYENLRRHPGAAVSFLKETFYLNCRHDSEISGVPRHRDWLPGHYAERFRQVIEAARRELAEAPAPGAREKTEAFLAHVGALAEAPVDDDWYGRLFAFAAPGQRCGDLTPDYSFLPPAGIEHLLRLSPAVKVLLVCREPVERDWSQLRMLLNAGEGSLEGMLGWPHCYERSNYPAIIARWRALLPPSQFRVLFYDHLQSRPREFLGEFARFVGLRDADADWSLVGERVFQGPDRPMPDGVGASLRRRHAATLRQMAERFPDPCAQWLARAQAAGGEGL